jgi:ABC-type lipoprotein export system ATPase subunit
MAEPYIVCDHLVKIYRVAERDVMALQGLDMVVARGEMLGVVGVSGSGKSTLMNLLGGLDRPSAGRLWIDGRDMLKLSPSQLDAYRARRVGFVWQQTARNLVPYLTARQNVLLPMSLARSSGPRRPRADELLRLTGLEARCDHRLAELSGGEQQRVAIAVALANAPDLLLADEPTGEVDEPTALSLYELFRELNQHLGVTVVIVSHDPHLAQHVDRVVAIRDGRVSTEASAAQGGPNGTHRAVDEVTVIDRAGRLQLPRPLLEQYGIHGRVRLEAVDGGILVRPADPARAEALETAAETLVDELEHASSRRRPARLLAWLRAAHERWARRGGRHD